VDYRKGEKVMLHDYRNIFSRISLCLFLAALLIAPGKVSAGDDLDGIKAELGKSDWKEKVILDMTHLPIADKKADVVWRLNPPSPIAGVKDYIVNLQPASHAEFKENRKVLVLLGFVSGAVDMLNVLEAVRVMKDDGVFVEGMPYREDSVNELTGILDGMRSALKKRGLDMGAAPLKQVKYEIFELDRRINEMWSKYGVELDLIDHKPFFFVGSYSKNETKLDLWFNEAKKSLSSPLGQLSKIERFWEIIDDMGKSKKLDNTK